MYQCKKKDRNWQQRGVAIKTCSEVAKTIIAIKLVVNLNRFIVGILSSTEQRRSVLV